MKYPRIKKILNKQGLQLTLMFDNDVVKKIDLSKLKSNKVFEKLENPVFFNNAKVDSGGYAIVWDQETDISEAYLWDNGITVSNEEIRSKKSKHT